MTEIKGLLLNVRRFSFPDSNTGAVIEGAKVAIGTNPDSPEADSVGLKVVELSIPYSQYAELSRQASSLIGKGVTLLCNVQPKGKSFAFVPVQIKG